MLDLIREILTSPAGSLGFVISLLGLGFFLTYWVTKKVTTIISENENIKKGADKLESHIDDIRRDLAYVKGSIDIIKGPSPAMDLIQSHSPISLTENGKKVADDIKAYDIVARNWDDIYKILNAELVNKTPYDIQQYCIESISVEPERFFSKPDLDLIKRYAFNHGRPLELYTRMISIIIRNKYFEVKNITIDEVDKTTPGS